jgi:hypothetical protein
MSPSIFSGLPNDLIMKVIEINTTTMNAEKQEIKNKFKSCMDTINDIPYKYSLYYDPEYHKSKPIYHKVSCEFWLCYIITDNNIETHEDESDDEDESNDEYDY